MLNILGIAWPGPIEMVALAALGLLMFGKRLPEVGRNIGKSIIEFKRGLKEAEQEISAEPTPSLPGSQQTLAPKYKFDPHTGKPLDEQA